MLPGRVAGQGGGATPGPLLLDATIRDRLIAKARAGIPITVSWRAEGISPDTWKNWCHVATYGVWKNGSVPDPQHLAIIEEFVDRYGQARAQWQEERIANIDAAGFVENPKTGMRDWRAHQWLLEHGADSRRDWFAHRPEQVVKVSETDAAKRPSLRDKSDSELIDLMPDADRERWQFLLGGDTPKPDAE